MLEAMDTAPIAANLITPARHAISNHIAVCVSWKIHMSREDVQFCRCLPPQCHWHMLHEEARQPKR